MKGIVETVAGVIERLSISSTEKKRLKQELETLLVDYEREHLQVQSGVLRSEVRPAHGETPYLRFGSWPLYGLTVLLLGLALALRPKAHPWAREL